MKPASHSLRFSEKFILSLVLLCSTFCFSFVPPLPAKEYYQIKVYHVKDKAQEERVENYLKNAFIPAVNKAGIKRVGVFKPVGNDTSADRRIFVFMPFSTLNKFAGLPGELEKDKAYVTAGADYLEAAYNNPPYTRMEVIQTEAFTNMPQMQLPQLKGPMAERIYELRSYESATERTHLNKVKQFNEGGEIRIFNKLGFNAVFYSRVIAGSTMPNLMYMTTFENKASRDEHWKAFSADPEWKTLSALPEYQHNVSRNVTLFLTPADYSQI
jgi:hypothetical protein